MPASDRSQRSRRLAAGAYWGAWLGALLLAAAEACRPGFLGLPDGAGWLALLAVLAIAACLGAALGLIRALPARLRRVRRGGRLLLWWLPLVLVPALVALVTATETAAARSTRVVVLGLDGATWDVIDPLIAAGELPNLERLRLRGATGILRSEEPTLSPRVWTTMATGVGPERHGAVDFFSTQDQLRAPRIWEIVAARGEPVGIWEWLLTWPPDELDGFVVPGWLLRGSETWPPELATYQELRGGPGSLGPGQLAAAAWWGYRNGLRLPTLATAAVSALRLKALSPQEREASPLETLVHGEMAGDLFVHHWRRVGPRFAALVLYATDSLGHRFWADFASRGHEPGGAPRDPGRARVLLDAYRQGDRVLGRLMRAATERTLVVVVSDHGMRGLDEDQALYAVRSDALIDALGMRGRLNAFSVGMLLQLRETEPGDSDAAVPDWVRALEGVEAGGGPLFAIRPVGARDFVVQVRGAPSLDQTVQVGERAIALDELLSTSPFSSEHTLDGIIGFWGSGVGPGATVRQATLRDVAPTLLTFMGLPLTHEMSGRVMREAFMPTMASRLQVKRIESYGIVRESRDGSISPEDREEIERRLRALGYVQ